MKPRYRLVQGLTRGLAILEALNARRGAAGSVLEIARATGLHRTTVKRSLETMRAAGYVQYSAGPSCYAVAIRARRLADNFRDEAWIAEVAAPALQGLTARIRWPSDLLTLQDDHFIVREATHPESPLSFSTNVFGARLPVMTSAAGRAYLTWCRADQRSVLLDLLRKRNDDEGAKARDARYVRRVLGTTRSRGYSVNEGAELGTGRLGVIAVPVVVRARVVACINVVFLLKAVTLTAIVERHLHDLQSTARSIASGIIRSSRTGRARHADRTKEVNA